MRSKKAPGASQARVAKAGKHKSRPGKIKKHHRAPRPSSLTATQLQTRADVFAAHSDMMRDPSLSASKAATNNGVTIGDFWKYIPKAFRKDSSGRIRAIADRYLRRMEIPGADGPILVKVRGYKAKTEWSRFRNDVFSFLGGDPSALDKWKDVTIQGHELLTDPDIIRLLGEQENLPENFGSEQVIPYSGGGA